MTNAAYILQDSPITDSIGPCTKCGNDTSTRFAFALSFDSIDWVLVGCTQCTYYFPRASSHFDHETLQKLPLSSIDDFARAVQLLALRLWPLTWATAAFARKERERR